MYIEGKQIYDMKKKKTLYYVLGVLENGMNCFVNTERPSFVRLNRS
jgi:hypothetical protein